MTGIGLFLMFLGYVAVYWAANAFQGKNQDSFASYIFPFVNPGSNSGANTGPVGPIGPVGKPSS